MRDVHFSVVQQNRGINSSKLKDLSIVVSSTIVTIIKDVGLRSMRVKYKDENSLLCRNCSDVFLAMGLPTSSGFIRLKKNTK